MAVLLFGYRWTVFFVGVVVVVYLFVNLIVFVF